MRNRNPLTSKLEEAQAALALAETTIQELRDFISDLLVLVGSRIKCPKCGATIFWVVVRGGDAKAFNANGSQHWPICDGAERPLALAATH